MQLIADPAAPPVNPADPTLERDAVELHRALSELVRLYQFRDRDLICCHDISVSQCYALEELIRRGPSTLNELAAGLFLDKSTASRVLDGLERKGYAVRTTHPSDRRALLIRSTPEGRALYEQIEGELLAEERRLLLDFEPEVRRSLTLLITRLTRAAAGRLDCGAGCGCT